MPIRGLRAGHNFGYGHGRASILRAFFGPGLLKTKTGGHRAEIRPENIFTWHGPGGTSNLTGIFRACFLKTKTSWNRASGHRKKRCPLTSNVGVICRCQKLNVICRCQKPNVICRCDMSMSHMSMSYVDVTA